jgi:hypothetical protein
MKSSQTRTGKGPDAPSVPGTRPSVPGTRPQLLAGWGRREFTPSLPFPLAGFVTRKDRLADRVRDPLAATAVVLSGTTGPVAFVSIDLLIVDEALFAAVRGKLAPLGVDSVFLNATHTHSSLGGYVEGRGARLFMGTYRPETRDHIAGAVEAAVREALGDMSPVSALHRGHALAPGITMNRRHRGGPPDDRISVLRLTRTRGLPILLFSVSGHPVIVSSMDAHAASADVPGDCSAALGKLGFLPAFVSGPGGGLNLLFPEMLTSVEAHMALLTRTIVAAAQEALSQAVPMPVRHAHLAMEVLEFRRRFPPTSGGPAGKAMKSAVTAAVGHGFSRFVGPGGHRAVAPVTVLRIGDAALVGMPADFGVESALALRDRIQADCGLFSIVSSQTNGYAGYAHPASDYAWKDSAVDAFFFYENAMAWFGPTVADDCSQRALKLLSAASPSQPES